MQADSDITHINREQELNYIPELFNYYTRQY
jgi:hypothetical protein